MGAQPRYVVYCIAGLYGAGPDAQMWIAARSLSDGLAVAEQVAANPFVTGPDGQTYLVDLAQLECHAAGTTPYSVAHYRRVPREYRMFRWDGAALRPVPIPAMATPEGAAVA